MRCYNLLLPLAFEPLYYGERLHIVNPLGDVGVCTLWSQVEQVRKVLEQRGVDLSPETSRIAAIANLYGNGLPQMLRNLLWNPQIRYLALAGQDLSGSREELIRFFEHGIEEVEFLGSPAHRIVQTKRILDGGVTPADFAAPIRIRSLGLIGDEATQEALAEFFATLPAWEETQAERRNIPIPETPVQRLPSEARSHTILRASPLEAWEELIFRLVRFGYRNKLRKGERIELQNMKVVIEHPVEDAAGDLRDYGFSLAHFHDYQRRMLSAEKPGDLSYTYGNRLRGYFRHAGAAVDSIEIAASRLRDDPESRHAYAALWDNSRDLPEGTECPCLVSVFFRRFEGKLTMTATFRTHNAMDAWLENVYGLIAVQRYVAENCGMEPGALTVFSHSIAIDTGSLEKARKVHDAKKTDDVVDRATGKRELRFDHRGNFTVTVDKDKSELVVQHSLDGMMLHEYRGRTAEAIENELARDEAVSLISHALYLGRELARKEMQLKAERQP